jgi:hypothetical protein
VNITKSISLTAPTGVYAGISVFPGSDGVTMATPNIYVTLRGITINSQGGNNGINVSAVSTLSVENVVVTNFTGINRAGIRVAARARVNVTDSLLRNNEFGLYFSGGAAASVIRTTVLGYGSSGVYADGAGNTDTNVSVTDSTITSYGSAITNAGNVTSDPGSSTITLSQNKLIANNDAVLMIGKRSFLTTYGNNSIPSISGPVSNVFTGSLK